MKEKCLGQPHNPGKTSNIKYGACRVPEAASEHSGLWWNGFRACGVALNYRPTGHGARHGVAGEGERESEKHPGRGTAVVAH